MSEEAKPAIQDSEKDAAVVSIGSNAASAAIPAPAPFKAKVKLPSKLGELQQRFGALGFQQRLIVAAALFLFISVLVFVSISGRSKDDYRVLFSSINERDGAAIVAALQQMNVPYKFTEGGAAILVPESSVYETRLRLAGQGLPKAGNVGFELLENQKLDIKVKTHPLVPCKEIDITKRTNPITTNVHPINAVITVDARTGSQITRTPPTK